jgi:hypothetical protein
MRPKVSIAAWATGFGLGLAGDVGGKRDGLPAKRLADLPGGAGPFVSRAVHQHYVRAGRRQARGHGQPQALEPPVMMAARPLRSNCLIPGSGAWVIGSFVVVVRYWSLVIRHS